MVTIDERDSTSMFPLIYKILDEHDLINYFRISMNHVSFVQFTRFLYEGREEILQIQL